MSLQASVVTPSGRHPSRQAAIIVGTALAYFVTGRLGLIFPFVGEVISLIWPASGVAFAAVWRYGWPAAAGVVVGAFLVNFTKGAELAFCIPVALGNALPAVIAWRFLKAECKSSHDLIGDPSNLSYFLAVAVLLAPMASSSIGAICLWLVDGQSPNDVSYDWLVWWAGDAVGVLIVAPALLSWGNAPRLSRPSPKWLEFGLLTLCLASLMHILFFSFDTSRIAPLSFGVLPLIVWTALRFPTVVLCQTILIIAVSAVAATSVRQGPFALEGFHESFVFLHSFLTAVGSVGLILGSSVQAFRRSIDTANANADRLRHQQNTMLSLINQDVLFQADLNEVLSQLTATTAATLDVQRVGFWRLSDNGMQLVSVNLYDASQDRHDSGAVLEAARYPTYFQALQKTQILAAEDARTHPDTREFTASYLLPLGIGAMLDIPVRLFGRLLGVLCFEHVGPSRIWRDDECFFALSMANLVAAAYEHDERRQAEASLQLAVTAFETSEGIMITDAESCIQRVNQAACAITGYEAEQLVGRSTHILHSERHDAAFYQRLWDTLMRDGRWEGEVWTRRSDGASYPQWISTNVVRNHNGAISHLVSTFIDISQRKKAEEEIARLAHFDSLTGLPNRRLIMDRLQQAFRAAQRAKRHGILMFVDLDHFKHLNDALGHAAGDQLLIQVAERLRQLGRQSDSVGRLGGDEFLVLLDSLCDSVESAVNDARLVADKILAEMSRPFALAGQLYHVGASIGVSVFPEGCHDMADVLKQADTAMYRAKASSRNTVRFFESGMQDVAEARLEIERALREALRQEELQIFLQPQIAPDGIRHAAEVLLRWNRPGHGWISPDLFIPVAEESGFICQLGDWVLAKAATALCELARRGDTCDIAVNVSPRQFRQADFVYRVRAALEDAGAPPERLVLELTENALIDDLTDAIAKMTELCGLGVRFSIDDFGTGYSSLAYLRRLPVSEIKIDRSFINDVITDPSDAAIVDAILAMAERLNLKVVAEGVESAEQLRFLQTRGCKYFQGYFYSPPMPWAEFME